MLFYIIRALNGIMWLDDRNRLYYNMKPEIWVQAISTIVQSYEDPNETIEHDEIRMISEVIRVLILLHICD